MIYIDRLIVISNNEATIEQPIVLYKGDKNVQLLFTLRDSYLKYKSMENAYGQLIIKRETASPIFSEQARLSSGKVTFVVTKEMIDELVEIGSYDFQIRIFNQDKTSRATLPPISGGILIREPILEEEVPNEVNIAVVNEVEIVSEDEELEVFDNEGNYNKTDWQDGDIITDVKLNKIEQAIYEINEKEVEVDTSTLATKEELENKADVEHTHEEYITEIPSEYITQTELEEELETKANENHTHNEYAPIDNPSFTGSIIFDYARARNLSPMHNDELITKSYADKTYAEDIHIHSTYVEKSTLSSYAKTEDLHEHTNKTVLDGITQEKVTKWSNKSEFDGDYNSLTNKPTIPSIEGLASTDYVDEKVPTKISQLENDSNFTTQAYVTEAINKAQFEGNDGIDLSIYAKLEDLHEHENKTVLDGITEETWNNKAELDSPTFIGNVKIERGGENYDRSLAIGGLAEDSSLAVGGIATGNHSVAFGIATETNKASQFVHGYANIIDEEGEFPKGKYLHIVGNGYQDEDLNLVRSNAYTLDWNGNAWYQGKLTIEGTPTEDKDVTTKAYVDTLISTKANEEHTHSEYVLKTDLPTDYLTEIPSEYVTEDELNSKGYLTEHQNISHLALKTEIPTKTSQLTNDSNFLTEHQSLDEYAKLTDIPSLDEYAKKEELTTAIKDGNRIVLTTNKYQYVDMSNTTVPIIYLPTVTTFTEIHLFFTYIGFTIDVYSDGATIKYQDELTYEVGNIYEFIATYVPPLNCWLVGRVEYK